MIVPPPPPPAAVQASPEQKDTAAQRKLALTSGVLLAVGSLTQFFLAYGSFTTYYSSSFEDGVSLTLVGLSCLAAGIALITPGASGVIRAAALGTGLYGAFYLASYIPTLTDSFEGSDDAVYIAAIVVGVAVLTSLGLYARATASQRRPSLLSRLAISSIIAAFVIWDISYLVYFAGLSPDAPGRFVL